MLPISAPLRPISSQHMSDPALDIARLIKVKCDGTVVATIYDFQLVFTSTTCNKYNV